MIVIPCRRAIGSEGKLHGCTGGLQVTAALLDHEWTMAQDRARAAELLQQDEQMKYQALLDQMIEVRGYLLQSANGLTLDQLTRVPPGFRNNILWNIGHVITDNCTMLYPPSGHPFPLPDHYLRWFEPGTSPEDWTETPSISEILNAGARMRDQLTEDCRAGRMENYEPMALDDGVTLPNIAYAIAHCNIHEGIHLGVIMALRKLV